MQLYITISGFYPSLMLEKGGVNRNGVERPSNTEFWKYTWGTGTNTPRAHAGRFKLAASA
jgi:hypothetical protein